jgi:hypothetical protein
MDFDAPAFAIQLRELVEQMVEYKLNQLRPPDAIGNVVSLDTANKIANVNFPPDTTTVPVHYTLTATPSVNSVVRVTGERGPKRFIVAVIA